MEKSECISRNLCVDHINNALHGSYLSKKVLRDLLEYIESTQSWREEVLEALLQCGAYCDGLKSNPKAALKALIKQEVDMALDPLISERAMKLLSTNPSTVLVGY